MGESYYDSQSLHRPAASSNIALYSRFIRSNGSITLIRAETERYDIVRFSKVTTKSLVSGTGSWESNELGEGNIAGELWPGPRLGVKTRSRLVCRPCDCISGNLNKTSVRETFGVYLPIGWVFTSYSMIFRLCRTSDEYAWLSCFAKIFCASHKNVSLEFSSWLYLGKQLSTQKLDVGLVSAGSNGFEPKRLVFADRKVIICVLCFIEFVVYSMRNPVVYRAAKKVVFC